MLRIRNHLVGVVQGEVILFSDFDRDGDMWVGEGPRKSTQIITFSEPYARVPAVSCWISMQDISNETFTRTDVLADRITPKEFRIVFRTWGDTKIARIRVSWLAIGELAGEDDWEITS